MRHKKIAALPILIGICMLVMLTPTRGFMLQSPSTVIPVGKDPEAIAVNPLTNVIYVANFDSNSVSVIDGKTNTVTATINVGFSPVAIAIDPATNMVYVANSNDGTISVVDAATNTVIKTIEDDDSAVANIAINPTTKLLYVLSFNDLKIIDAETKTTFITTISGDKIDQGPPSPFMLDLALDATRNVIHIAYRDDHGHAYISAIDTKINTPMDNIYLGEPIEVERLAVNSVTDRLYALSNDSLSIIDAATKHYLMTTHLDNVFDIIAVNSATNVIYVADFDDNVVAKIDGRTNRVIAVVKGVEEPSALVINPTTNTLYVASRDTNTVSVIGDGSMPTVTPTYTPGGPTITPSATIASGGGEGGP